MPGDDSADLATKPLDPKYFNGLLDNINNTQDHLAGNDGTPLSPSFLPPNAIWTPREKDTFFHALSIYSRFRPDLISHEIKTKSVPDVCNYLSVLHLAASRQETAVPYPQWRQNLSIAMEVSPEWVAMEEEAACEVIAREQDWQRELVAERRRAELKSLRKHYKTAPHDVGPSQRRVQLKQEIANANLRDKRQDFCGSLGSLELAAIGAILREDTGSPGSSQIKQPSALYTPAPQDSPEPVSVPESPQTLPSSVTKVAKMRNPPNPTRRWSNSNGEPSSLNQDSTTLLTELSPTSRRRYQKRLYMRRKRASESGVTTIDDSLERLKPGRKKAKRPPPPEDETPPDLELPTSVVRDVESGISVSGAGGSGIAQKRYPRAKRMAIDDLRDLDLDADGLRGLGLDVVNPEGIAKMLDLWDKLSGDTSGHGSRISIETIQILNAHVVWFVKSLIFRAITLREQEWALKSETKVWKLPGKPALAREHIERSVSMANSRELNKAGFFEGIVADMDINFEAEKKEGEPAESWLDVALLPPHRDIYAPFVWIPELRDDSEMTDNTSDEEVDDELLEEEELDELDMDIEMEHESGLWDKAQRLQTSGPKIEAPLTKGGRRKANKRAEYIEDSD